MFLAGTMKLNVIFVFCPQSDIIHQSVFELIHTEDRPEFQRQLHWALTPDSDELGKVVQGTIAVSLKNLTNLMGKPLLFEKLIKF